MRHTNPARIAAASAFALSILSGCSTYDASTYYLFSNDALQCPDAVILANTAVLPAFDPAKGADPSGVIYTARMTDVSTRCDYAKREFTADARLVISYTATRPPGGEAAKFRVPYFVAVTNEGVIADKQNFWLNMEFQKGATSISGSEAVDSVIVKVDKAKKPYEYHLIVGFQLTKAQIDYNKKMGQDAP
jgi:hypothetical protein